MELELCLVKVIEPNPDYFHILNVARSFAFGVESISNFAWPWGLDLRHTCIYNMSMSSVDPCILI